MSRSQMALNNDLAPIFASLAGLRPPSFVDGRSLRALLSASPPSSWRNALLVASTGKMKTGPLRGHHTRLQSTEDGRIPLCKVRNRRDRAL